MGIAEWYIVVGSQEPHSRALQAKEEEEEGTNQDQKCFILTTG